jgi:beta-glucuronidase
MTRLFETHNIRKYVSLNGTWNFINESTKKEYILPVPGCWEQHPDMKKYQGKGIYTKVLKIEKNTDLRLEFKGVSHTADVFFDGEKIAHHYNAFTPFSACVTNVKAGEHKLEVHVDNAFSEDSVLHKVNDYYTYGGITRAVVLEEIDGEYIEYVHFLPKNVNGIWRGEISVCVKNLSDIDFTGTIVSELGGTKVDFGEVTVKGGESRVFSASADFSDVSEWNMETPNLYLLNSVLYKNGVAVDDLIERVGFRTVSAEKNKVLLNGKEIFMKGYNRHEDHSVFGCALPLQMMAQDLDLIVASGANAVRTSHYPNDELFLDLCDERGIIVWEENHARSFDIKWMLMPNFDKQCYDCIEEMIINHFNHPSIIIWGILNECASDCEEGRAKYKMQYEQIKSMDTSRLTTSATCRHFNDICLDLPDIISINTYPGWYGDDVPREEFDQLYEWVKKELNGVEKPIYISEFGAGAIYGSRDDRETFWSEQKQAEILDKQLEAYLNDDRISGALIWQFCDCRVSDDVKLYLSRPNTRNNKGILDVYRRKKMAYDVVTKHFTNKK